MQRGAIGKGRRAFERWYNKDEIEKQQIAKIKADKAKAMADKQADMEKHMGAEKLRVQVSLGVSGLFLYTGGILFHVECCIRQLWCSSTILYNIASIS